MAIVKINKERYWNIFMLKEGELEAVRNAGIAIDFRKEAIFEEFYAWLEFQREYRDVYTENVIKSFEKRSSVFWEHVFSAKIDEEAIRYREDLVFELLKLNLSFEAYLSAVFGLQELIEKAFIAEGLASFELMRAFKKVVSIGIFIAIDTYNNEMNRQLQAQNDMLMQLSTPITPIWEGILLLPIIGIVASLRAKNIMTTVLLKVAQCQAKVFILDISGLRVVDSVVASHFIVQLSRMVKLMGCKTILSGIAPIIAQTLVKSKLDVGELITKSNLKNALEIAFDWTGRTVVAKSVKN